MITTQSNNDTVIRYIKTKNKIRKLVMYNSKDCMLRSRHIKILDFLKKRFVPSIFTKGYVKKRSIYQNALAHMYNDKFVMLDIKDFFPNICHTQLADKIFYEINLKRPHQISRRECFYVVRICSVNKRGIPLGFITSPILSNIYMKEFDNIFYGKLKNLGLSNIIYTRYADDITVSYKDSNKEEFKSKVCEISSLASSLLAKYGLKLNNNKTRYYDLSVSNHVRITGVNLTKQSDGSRKLTVGRAIKNKMFWEAVKCLESPERDRIYYVKGLQSFILSIEKKGSEDCYSPVMMQLINSYGHKTLKELIDSL